MENNKKSVKFEEPSDNKDDNNGIEPPPSAWKHRVNEITRIQLVGRREEIGKEEEERKPEYMHPFFGDDEEIEGYIDPHLSLIFSRYSFKLYIKFEYKEKREEKKKRGIMTSLPPTQVIEKLLPFFPNDAITYDLDVFCNWLDIDRRSASPFGDLVATYFPSDVKSNNNNNNNTENNEGKKEEEEVTYEVRWCKFIEGGDRNEELIRFHERIQLFVLLEIDGGTFIETNDHRWELFLLYEHHSANGKGKGSKGKGMGKGRDSLLGYCSAYEFYHHPDQFRVRISQFLLFPQYQRKGHGRNLLNAIYKHAIARNVLDIPVEDPSLDFSRLRDMVDMSNLILGRYFSPSQKSISADQIKLIVLKHRLWKKQVRRCFEIFRLNYVNKSNEEEYKEYRIYVKRRLMQEYREQLELFPEGVERKEELHRVYQQLEADYTSTILKLKHNFQL